MSQFLQTFYEESFEGLETMESGLLSLEADDDDTDNINNIFRAAHSIKGGSGTFGLDDVAGFTHVLETLLDEMRDGQRHPEQNSVNLMLKSVDVLRGMLTAHRDDCPVDEGEIREVQTLLEAELANKGGAAASADSAATVSDAGGQSAGQQEMTAGNWSISFKPFLHILKTGNDPLRMLRELNALGELKVEAELSQLPEFNCLDPEECHLAWKLELRGNVDRNDIDEVFAWVVDDCELDISPLPGSGDDLKASKTSAIDAGSTDDPGAVSGELLVERRKSDDRRQSERRTAGKGSAEGTSIRVGTDKIDSVINLVGELVITQSMLSTMGQQFTELTDGLAQLERNTRELQEEIMRMRMLPISFAFNRFPRLVHDLSQKLGKKIELKLTGEQTELDKTVIEKISDPLVHLVRNSLDHGIEMPEDRIKAGKPETGLISLDACHKGGNIVISITDDGKGLDHEKILQKALERGLVDADTKLTPEQVYELVFMPGFSTADVVSDVSGRGVGMDVVRRNIQSLGGGVEITSETGKGSTFTVRLPLTLAIVDGQTVVVGDEQYIVPIVNIIESMQLKPGMVNKVAGKGDVFELRNEYVPIIRLYEAFGAEALKTELTEGLLVVVEADGKKIGLFVDDLTGQQQVVIKSLENNYRKVDGISGATILGDGSVALILDIPGLIRLSHSDLNIHKLKKSA